MVPPRALLALSKLGPRVCSALGFPANLEEAVRIMSGSVADRVNIRDRGQLRAGLFADVPWWCVAGGHAVELAVGRPLRPHSDIDVLLLRRDQLAAQHALAVVITVRVAVVMPVIVAVRDAGCKTCDTGSRTI